MSLVSTWLSGESAHCSAGSMRRWRPAEATRPSKLVRGMRLRESLCLGHQGQGPLGVVLGLRTQHRTGHGEQPVGHTAQRPAV